MPVKPPNPSSFVAPLLVHPRVAQVKSGVYARPRRKSLRRQNSTSTAGKGQRGTIQKFKLKEGVHVHASYDMCVHMPSCVSFSFERENDRHLPRGGARRLRNLNGHRGFLRIQRCRKRRAGFLLLSFLLLPCGCFGASVETLG